MRGIHSVVDDIRRDVFTEVARLAYEGGDYKQIDALPYKIIPGEVAQYRHDVWSAPSSPSAYALPAACPCAPPPSSTWPATASRRPPCPRSTTSRP